MADDLQDKYHGEGIGVNDPSNEFYPVEPANTSDLPHGQPKALFIGTGGNLTCVGEGSDEPVLFKNLPDGCWAPIRPRRIMITGTDAEDIVALY